LIVAAKIANALQVLALDDAAARLGLSAGMPLANARAVCPDIEVADADEAADRETLERIADWCDRFTPLIGIDPPHGLLLDITGCTHLFGGEAELMRSLCRVLTRQGFAVSAARAVVLPPRRDREGGTRSAGRCRPAGRRTRGGRQNRAGASKSRAEDDRGHRGTPAP
jgi:nucleotidyltransferase/DNA polymerase involved in DNA repair